MNIGTSLRIKLGTYANVHALKSALQPSGFPERSSVEEMLDLPAFTIADTEIEIELVIVSAKDLGLSDRASISTIRQEAIKNGLDLCPAEVGPQLVLQYPELLDANVLRVEMKPIVAASGRYRTVFSLSSIDGVPHLGFDYGFVFGGDPYPDMRVVFMRSGK